MHLSSMWSNNYFLLRKENLNFDKKVYCGLSAITYILHFMIQCLLQIYIVLEVKGFDFLISFVLLIVCVLILVYVIVYISKLYKNKEEYEQLLTVKENERILSHLYNEVKITKHDLKHDFNLLQYYVDRNDIQNIKEIIKHRNNQVEYIPSLVASKNDLLNTIINNKLIEAYSKELRVQCRVVVSANISISNYDLNQLLSNMLDNAIENCRKNGEIDIQIIQEGDFLHIQISNSITDSAIKKGLKTKKDNRYHGFGLKSIKKICQKYNATVNIREENQKFYIQTTLIL